jgi:hypothetical protein
VTMSTCFIVRFFVDFVSAECWLKGSLDVCRLVSRLMKFVDAR